MSKKFQSKEAEYWDKLIYSPSVYNHKSKQWELEEAQKFNDVDDKIPEHADVVLAICNDVLYCFNGDFKDVLKSGGVGESFTELVKAWSPLPTRDEDIEKLSKMEVNK